MTRVLRAYRWRASPDNGIPPATGRRRSPAGRVPPNLRGRHRRSRLLLAVGSVRIRELRREVARRQRRADVFHTPGRGSAHSRSWITTALMLYGSSKNPRPVVPATIDWTTSQPSSDSEKNTALVGPAMRSPQ